MKQKIHQSRDNRSPGHRTRSTRSKSTPKTTKIASIALFLILAFLSKNSFTLIAKCPLGCATCRENHKRVRRTRRTRILEHGHPKDEKDKEKGKEPKGSKNKENHKPEGEGGEHKGEKEEEEEILCLTCKSTYRLASTTARGVWSKTAIVAKKRRQCALDAAKSSFLYPTRRSQSATHARKIAFFAKDLGPARRVSSGINSTRKRRNVSLKRCFSTE